MVKRSKWCNPYTTHKVVKNPDESSFAMNSLRESGWGYGRLANHFGIPPWEVGMHISAARHFLKYGPDELKLIGYDTGNFSKFLKFRKQKKKENTKNKADFDNFLKDLDAKTKGVEF